MARKQRNLASFNDVANTNLNKNNNDNKNINVNNNVDVDVNDNANSENSINNNQDYINEILNDKKSKRYEEKYIMSGIYIEKDLAVILDKLAKKGGKGAKSKIVNEALRKAFSNANLI